jgi:hypothetical protein
MDVGFVDTRHSRKRVHALHLMGGQWDSVCPSQVGGRLVVSEGTWRDLTCARCQRLTFRDVLGELSDAEVARLVGYS